MKVEPIVYDFEKAGKDDTEIEVQEGRLQVLIRKGVPAKFEADREVVTTGDYMLDKRKVYEYEIELLTEVLS